MDIQPEYFILNIDKHIKPPYNNHCKNIKEVANFRQFKLELENAGNIDFVYLCYIINDNYDMIKPLSKHLSDTIRKYIETNIDTGIENFWEIVSKEGDYSYKTFQKRKFPSRDVTNEKFKLIAETVNKNINYKDYPNRNKTVNKYKSSITNKDKSDTNYNSIMVLPVEKYYDEFSLEDITTIFTTLYKLEEIGLMIKLWCKLMIQFDTVHLVLHNSQTWDIMKNIMNKPNVKNIMNYSMFYGLFILNREELLLNKSINENYRCIFNSKDNINIKAIIDCNVNSDPWNNVIAGSPYTTSRTLFHLDGPRSLTSDEVFNRRLYIITGGVFNNIDLTKYNAVLTGSVLIPCAAYNPLEKYFIGSTTACVLPDSIELTPIRIQQRTLTDDEFRNYINYYYPPDSEVDKKNNNPEFVNDIDIGVLCNNMEDYIKQSKLLIKAIRNNIPQIEIKEIATLSTIKYKIIIPGHRCIDIFPANDKNPCDLVWRFHVSAVKMYWDGKHLHKFKSCETALRTGICESYGWMSCRKNGADIVLKYAQRGYSTVINKQEEYVIINYMITSDTWNIWPNIKSKEINYLLKKIKNNKYNTTLSIVGTYTDRHIFFHPNQINNGFGIRYGMIHKKYENGGKMQIETSNNISYNRYKSGISIAGIDLDYRTKDGINIKVPNVALIDNIASKLFM